ncbi:MAG TPA: methionine--tRNA ligase subunit beta, partial [Halanaerobiales bacterium]|nr:methionine--tRNA ligase subunit beta [Halanaerobiales bacterium]
FIAGFLKPFMVETPYEIGRQLGIPELIGKSTWEDLKEWGLFPSGIKINKGNPLFPRIDAEEYFDELEKRKNDKNANIDEKQKGKDKPMISFDEFKKMDLRVAEVIKAEKIEKSDKLLKLQVDLGYEKRQLVAGIAKYYQPEEITGKKIIIIANLEPATIFGVESNGMILAASAGDEELALTTVDGDIENGSRIS